MKLIIGLIFALSILLAANPGYFTNAQDSDVCQWAAQANVVVKEYFAVVNDSPAGLNTQIERLQTLYRDLEALSRPESAEAALTAIHDSLRLIEESATNDTQTAAGTIESAKAALATAQALNDELCSLIIADFNNCTNRNNLGGDMGAAYTRPDKLVESYMPDQDSNRGCVVKLKYEIKKWAAFWMQLNQTDLSLYNTICFDIRADDPLPTLIKIELKRDNSDEWEVRYIPGPSKEWSEPSVCVALEDFEAVAWANPFSALTEMEELVFVVEQRTSGDAGTIYLDNIVARP